jgi:hypothetical protein
MCRIEDWSVRSLRERIDSMLCEHAVKTIWCIDLARVGRSPNKSDITPGEEDRDADEQDHHPCCEVEAKLGLSNGSASDRRIAVRRRRSTQSFRVCAEHRQAAHEQHALLPVEAQLPRLLLFFRYRTVR